MRSGTVKFVIIGFGLAAVIALAALIFEVSLITKDHWPVTALLALLGLYAFVFIMYGLVHECRRLSREEASRDNIEYLVVHAVIGMSNGEIVSLDEPSATPMYLMTAHYLYSIAIYGHSTFAMDPYTHSKPHIVSFVGGPGAELAFDWDNKRNHLPIRKRGAPVLNRTNRRLLAQAIINAEAHVSSMPFQIVSDGKYNVTLNSLNDAQLDYITS